MYILNERQQYGRSERKRVYLCPNSRGQLELLVPSPVLLVGIALVSSWALGQSPSYRYQNGSFASLNGGAVIFAQQAVTFLCLDFSGTSTRYNSLPPGTCPDGVRAQIVGCHIVPTIKP
ncbi:hypothetical protein H0H92_006154 [Tricholoma furcatifolium]|nr:hypothetical protein H0H92_006154 [Tricholoma furcatifolium]